MGWGGSLDNWFELDDQLLDNKCEDKCTIDDHIKVPLESLPVIALDADLHFRKTCMTGSQKCCS